MGRKTGSLYINSKKFGAVGKPCMKEMVSFLNCLALGKNNDEKCLRHKDLLASCMESQVRFISAVKNFSILLLQCSMWGCDHFCRGESPRTRQEPSITICNGSLGRRSYNTSCFYICRMLQLQLYDTQLLWFHYAFDFRKQQSSLDVIFCCLFFFFRTWLWEKNVGLQINYWPP